MGVGPRGFEEVRTAYPYQADGSSATTPHYPDDDEFLWSKKHINWACRVGEMDCGNTQAFLQFCREVSYDTALAPKWLHAFWDVATEGQTTSRREDAATGRRLLRDEAFRLAFEVAYDSGGIPAAVELTRKVARGEL